MNKRIKLLSTLGLSLAVASPLAVVACGGKEAISNKEITGVSGIFLITDDSDVDDKSFNQQAFEALGTITKIPAAELKETRVKKPSGHGANTIYHDGYLEADKDGANLMIAAGFYHEPAIEIYNNRHRVNRSNFILLDSEVKSSNVASVQFDVKYASFQAGYLAAKYLEATGDTDPTIGMWGGGAIPSVTNFLTGFTYGVVAYNNEKDVSKPLVKFAQTAKDKVDWTDSGFQATIPDRPSKGKEFAKNLILKGADILFPVAGGQTHDAINELNARDTTESINAQRAKARVVGVDMNQADIFTEVDSNKFITSVEKRIKTAVEQVFKVIDKDTTANTSLYKGLGELTMGSLTNNLVKVSDNTTSGYGGWNGVANAAEIYETVSSWNNAAIDAKISGEKKLSDLNWDDAYEVILTMLVTS